MKIETDIILKSLYNKERQLLGGKGQIYTPKVIRDKILKFITPQDKNICILYNIEFILDLYNNDEYNLTFVSDDKIRNDIVKNTYKNVKVILIDNTDFKEGLKGMKFDLIISNPPYTHQLDLKILNQIHDLADKFCIVHPSYWLLDKRIKKGKITQKSISLFESKLNYVELLNGNNIFDISIFIPIAITVFNKTGENIIVNDTINNLNYIVNNINDIDIHGNSDIYKSLKYKILNYCINNDNILNHMAFSNSRKSEFPNEYQLGHSTIRGNNFKNPDYFTLIQLTNENNHIGKETKYCCKYYFDTRQELFSFKNYLKLKLSRFCLSIFKLNQQLCCNGSNEIESIPYMPTYEHNWSDKDVANEIGLTDEELEWAINWIPNYYPEDKL